MHKATLRLFNAIQVNDRQPSDIAQTILERTLRNGYLLDSAIQPEMELLDTIDGILGLSGEKANAAFHKSWTVVQEASLEQLVIQQIIHYLTTYGFKQLGIYHGDTVYIPHEVLQLPQIREDIPLVVIKALDQQEIYQAVLSMGRSGIALAQETLEDILSIIRANEFDSELVKHIRNRELRALLYDYYGLIPTNPEEYLRYLIAKLTGESLVIKNNDLIEKIKASDGSVLDVLLNDAPEDLASIFFRFKPLFLALKTISNNKTFFNRLRKQADKQHKPLPEDYANTVTAHIKWGDFDLALLKQKLAQINVFRKIRLAYALKFREAPAGDSIVYRVRNGRGWATGFDWSDSSQATIQQALDIVLKSITADLRKNVNGRTIYIPSHVNYAMPASEKQFTGNLPTGSYVSIPRDLIVGIHWVNTNSQVDLDLSVIGESGKIGWDAAYRTEDRSILFSGDVVDAPPPNGATELFYLRQSDQEARILMVNYFNHRPNDEVRCRILAAHEEPTNFGRSYMVDINHIVATAEINITQKQNILGLIINIEGENRIYFAKVSIGTSITASQNRYSTNARRYLVRSLTNTIDFRHMLQMAGANIVDTLPNGEYLDLSPHALDKSTIINLVI